MPGLAWPWGSWFPLQGVQVGHSELPFGDIRASIQGYQSSWSRPCWARVLLVLSLGAPHFMSSFRGDHILGFLISMSKEGSFDGGLLIIIFPPLVWRRAALTSFSPDLGALQSRTLVHKNFRVSRKQRLFYAPLRDGEFRQNDSSQETPSIILSPPNWCGLQWSLEVGTGQLHPCALGWTCPKRVEVSANAGFSELMQTLTLKSF